MTPQARGWVPAPQFWPPSDQHCIGFLELRPDRLPAHVQHCLPAIRRLAALGDAIRALQGTTGGFASDAAAVHLLQESADVLRELADSLPPATGEVLRLRAAGLLDGQTQAAAAQQVDAPDDPLVVLCGPLSTWRSKSTRPLHGVIVATPAAALNELIGAVDALIPTGLETLRTLLGEPRLYLGAVPPFVITHLIACGGEANTFPKHFSYFLPEDEGVKRAAHKKTIVFPELYHERFHQVSLTMYRRVCVEQPDLERDRSLQHLLVWFRGHDIGHSLLLPETDYQALRALGFSTSVMLQEAIADVSGFLLATSGEWSAAGQLTLGESTTAFLAELLRYVRRGARSFPDSGAAYLELSYLVENGYVALLGDGRELSVDPARVRAGMVALASDLVEVVLRGNLELARELLGRHTLQEGHPLMRLYDRVRLETRDLPTAFAYTEYRGD